MPLTLYDATVANYLQMTRSLSGVLQKGRAHYEEKGLNVDELPELRLCEDMLPFSFQINSVRHHSVHAIQGVEAGAFAPPKPLEKTDYQSLQDHITQTISDLEAMTPDHVNALGGRDLVFTLGENKLPFEAEGFLMSFSLPNFYFHITTTYDLLRMKGVPLSKRDYLAGLKLKKG